MTWRWLYAIETAVALLVLSKMILHHWQSSSTRVAVYIGCSIVVFGGLLILVYVRSVICRPVTAGQQPGPSIIGAVCE